MNKFILSGVALLFICTQFQSCLSTSNSASDAISLNDSSIEQKVDSVLALMTLEEKIGQTAQRGTSSRGSGITEELKDKVRNGEVGSFLNINSAENTLELQRLAIEESPNGIPLIFGRDVIHGFHTIFPIPLGQAATWNPELVELGARIAAKEANATGVNWTFAPMLDIARDPRWGRIAESAGEDPYLTSVMGKAYVRGFQTDDLSSPRSVAACAKHFIGYGAAEGGRDYNSASIHDEMLHNTYLKPFKAVKDIGVATYMSSFNELNGVPASGNKYVLSDILRGKWGFDGFVVSDWNSVTEMIYHGFSANEKEAAYSAARAGLDMEMTSTAFDDNLKELIEEGRIPESQLDEMVKNIIRVKFKMGLFDNPYFVPDSTMSYREEHLEAAKKSAVESFVLLKNEKDVLPLSTKLRKVAVIGPLADQQQEQLGTWVFDGQPDHSITPLISLKEMLGEDRVIFAPGLDFSRDRDTKGFSAAINAAKKSDIVLFFAGEEAILSGEAHSRADINLPGAQEELIKEIAKTGKSIVLVIMAGRPITLGNILGDVDAVIHAWHPGTMAGPALADLLMGNSSPCGRLPVTYPKSVGQIPFYYNHTNTGRPASGEGFVGIEDIPIGAWQSSLGNASHYLDDGYEPLYPFGYGLTYTKFEYTDLEVSESEISEGGTLTVKAKINNLGKNAGTEVVQLYMQDQFGSITRPVRELIDFQKIEIEPNATKEVVFEIHTDQLKFYNQEKKWVVEPGKFNIWIAPHASAGLKASFEVVQ